MAGGVDGRWSPGIGDATLRGWLTVGAYFLAAGLAAHAALATARLERSSLPSLHRRRLVAFWWITTVALVLLGLNKQLDLQSWFTQAMRDLAKDQGWYEARRQYQVGFILALGAIGALGTVTMAILLRHVLPRIGVALLGLSVLVTFVVARAASFHHLDALLHAGPFALNWWAEFGGIALIAVNACTAGRART